MRLVRRLRAVGPERGYTLVELIAVLAILITVVTSITALFVSAARAELELSRRFQAQQEARVAVDRMRREIHCSSKIVPGAEPARSITVTIPSTCPGAGGVQADVVWDVQQVTANRWRLRRAGIRVADHITSADVFTYVSPTTASLGKLRVQLPVNITPNEGWKTWRLNADIVLRNTTRSSS